MCREVMDEMATSAGYWAVGTDCCKRQGSFECGDAQSLGPVVAGKRAAKRQATTPHCTVLV